jgi:outer membrane immunogenic protein
MGIKMKKFIATLAFATTMLLPSVKAIAADLDTLPPPPPVEQLRPAAYDWSGGYVGGFIGAVCVDGTFNKTTAGPPVAVTQYLNAGCGLKGGGLVGYNIQMDDIVWGIEASGETTGNIVTNLTPGADFKYKMDGIGRLNARAGWAMDDNLLFVMGGAAYGMGRLTDNVSTATPTDYTANHWGWSVGAGIEHAVTDQFHIRMDYMFTHFFDNTYNTAVCCNVSGGPGNEHEVRAAAVWSF